jgi:excisionase family DNA binding protein
LTVDEIAEFIQVKPKTIYNWVSMGMIPCIRRHRGFVRFKIEKVEKWLSEFEQKGRKRRKIAIGLPS